MPVKEIVKEHENTMKQTVDHLHHELKGIRTGRASTGLVDNLRVEYYGSPTPLNQMATVSAPDATSIVIKPFDPSAVGEIVKAISTSDLNMPPNSDGKTIRLTVPPLSEDRRKDIAAQVKTFGENSKVSIRNIRRDANKMLDDEQKSKLISEDDRDKGKREIDDLTKKYTGQIDDCIKAKSEEIMTE